MGGPLPKPMPHDFAEKSRGLVNKQIQYRYGIGLRVLYRWKYQAGMTRPRYRPELPREQIQHLTDTLTQVAAARQVGVSIPTWRKMQAAAGVQRGVAA